jgi:hypothetical protein
MFIIQNPKTIICWFTYPKKYRYIASAEIPELKTYGTILIRSEIEPHTPDDCFFIMGYSVSLYDKQVYYVSSIPENNWINTGKFPRKNDITRY